MTRELSAATFDYSQIEDKELRGRSIARERELQKAKKLTAEGMLAIGKILVEQRADMEANGDRNFLEWMSRAGQFSQRTGYNFIEAFETFGMEDVATVARFEPTALYRLAETSTPKAAVKEARRLADRGMPITAKIAKDLIEKHKGNGTEATATRGGANRQDGGGAVSRNEPVGETETSTEDATGTGTSCLECGPHSWTSDGNGDRYCETCKEDHPNNKPKASAAKYLGGIAATVAKCRVNIDDVVREFGKHKLTDKIMADLDEAYKGLKKWEGAVK